MNGRPTYIDSDKTPSVRPKAKMFVCRSTIPVYIAVGGDAFLGRPTIKAVLVTGSSRSAEL